MPEQIEYRGLCSTCNNAASCAFSRDPHRPVLQCEEFEGYQPPPPKAVEQQSPLLGTAVSGEDALSTIETNDASFDLYVIDIDMPGINGFELTEQIRNDERSRTTPVIICTSRASDEEKRKGISVGAQAYIIKGSFDQNVLLDTVKSLIGD